MNIFGSFTGKYTISKTLKFELKPIGKTKSLMNTFSAEMQDNPLEKDYKRSIAYSKVKKLFDEYYRYFIEDVLQHKVINIDFMSGYKLFISNDKQNLEKFNKAARKTIADLFVANKEAYGLKDYGKLYGKNGSFIEQWLNARLETLKNSEQTESVRNEIDKINANKDELALFAEFSTYFVPYKQNRDNMFASDGSVGSIAYRLIDENLRFYYINCQKFNKIKETYSDLYDDLAKICDINLFFAPENYYFYISQKGIDRYNSIIGRTADDIYSKGINQVVNEYKQKNHLSNAQLSIFNILYKQILSDREEIITENISNDKEMFQVANECYKNAINQIKEIEILLIEHIQSNQDLYFSPTILTNMSNSLLKDWSILPSIINSQPKKKDVQLFGQVISCDKLQALFDSYNKSCGGPYEDIHIKEYFLSNNTNYLNSAYENCREILALNNLDKDRRIPGDNFEGGKGYLQLEKIKNMLDEIVASVRFYKGLILEKNGKQIECDFANTDFYNKFSSLYKVLDKCIYEYNIVRNYVTKKPYSNNKFKLNFNVVTLGSGWDLNKEKDNKCVILLKDGRYYLGIMSQGNNKLFENLHFNNEGANCYEKMIYKQVSGVNKMFPKVFFSETWKDVFAPSQEILSIRDKKAHLKEANNIEAKNKWIEFCIDSFKKHPEWPHYFDVKFKNPDEYSGVDEFYKSVEAQLYSISFNKIPCDYIDKAVEEGKLSLFEIYNKDFSKYSKGKPNLHTLYWQAIFSDINISLSCPIFKLNGGAELFYRKASLPYYETHKANEPLVNKNPDAKKRTSVFEYPLVKDKRYSEDKLFFHCPITINFMKGNMFAPEFNKMVNNALKTSTDYNIIGIDRGERHLLYYTIIDKNGKILEQNSLNKIVSDNDYEVDYHKLLDQKEINNKQARKQWGTIEQIKDSKAGYLSQAIHKITDLMLKYNAVVVLEDLNSGFKNSRKKIEKQVYQNFEKALINKLSYLSNKSLDENIGSVMYGYQLAPTFESFEKIGKQCGFLYYVNPSYTSKICPATGFVNLLSFKYENEYKAKTFFSNMNSIIYNGDRDYFEIVIDYKKFGYNDLSKNIWTICSFGKERFFRDKDGKPQNIDVTQSLKDLLIANDIKFENQTNILPNILDNFKSTDYKNLCFIFSKLFAMRYTTAGTKDEDDYILSPIMSADGTFYDSRQSKDMPHNADANGAYHIALKGLYMLQNISENNKVSDLKRNEWFNKRQ